MTEKRGCKMCGGWLKSIGLDRKNGRGNYRDWTTRQFHKSCYNTIIKDNTLRNFYLK